MEFLNKVARAFLTLSILASGSNAFASGNGPSDSAYKAMLLPGSMLSTSLGAAATPRSDSRRRDAVHLDAGSSALAVPPLGAAPTYSDMVAGVFLNRNKTDEGPIVMADYTISREPGASAETYAVAYHGNKIYSIALEPDGFYRVYDIHLLKYTYAIGSNDGGVSYVMHDTKSDGEVCRIKRSLDGTWELSSPVLLGRSASYRDLSTLELTKTAGMAAPSIKLNTRSGSGSGPMLDIIILLVGTILK